MGSTGTDTDGHKHKGTRMNEMQSLARGLKLLDIIASAERGLTVTELAAMLQIDKSSVSRLIRTLAAYEYVQQDVSSRGYVIGKRLRQISFHLLNRMPIREKARHYLYRLMEETGECAHTAIYSDGKALVIDDVEAAASLRVVGGVGRLIPLHCTAVGKGLLAFTGAPFPTELEAITANTITEAEALHAHLAQIQAQGFAYDDEEHQPGVRCLAAPVYDFAGGTIAVIGISGPTVRITDTRVADLAQCVQQAARELSAELGYQPRLNGQKNKHG